MAAESTDEMASERSGRRGEIINVATRLFRERGYHVTSLDDLAEAIGFTKPAIYYYFDSKEDILFAIVEEIVDRAIERMQRIAEGGGSPTELLHALLVENTLVILENLDANTVLYNERGLLSEEREQALRRRERDYSQILLRLYEEGVAAGEFVDVDPALATNTLFGGSIWTHRWFTPGGRLPAAEVARHIADLLVEGVRRRD